MYQPGVSDTSRQCPPPIPKPFRPPSAPSDPSGGWYRSPHGDRGWSPPSKNYPEPPTSERDPWANWTDVEIPRHDHSKVSTNGGADEGYGIIRSMKCFARAAAQGHVAAQLELDRWLPSVAKSLTGLEAGNRVFLGGFAAEDWEFLNGEAAVSPSFQGASQWSWL